MFVMNPLKYILLIFRILRARAILQQNIMLTMSLINYICQLVIVTVQEGFF